MKNLQRAGSGKALVICFAQSLFMEKREQRKDWSLLERASQTQQANRSLQGLLRAVSAAGAIVKNFAIDLAVWTCQ